MFRLQTSALMFGAALVALPARAVAIEGWTPALELRVHSSSPQESTSTAAGTWQMYTADLWLVHTGPDGQERREHLIVNMDGSTPMPFMFRRLTFPVPVIDARQGNAVAIIQLSGALRTRPREDGAIDLDIDTNRRLFSFEYPNRHAPSSIAPARKTVTVKPDETTAIDFPPPGSGFVSLMMPGSPSNSWGIGGGRVGAPPADGPVLEVVNDRLVLHTSRFFKGHRTQLLIRLRRAD